ncbi:hypothetical protein KA050_04140 [Candidatus Gracilibacteria bacterium]|nr:hypothetical protein [Candidatus Gracilibacteria bacterium]
MNLDDYAFIHMRKPTEHKKHKERSKKDQRYLRRLSHELDLRNTIHSHTRIQQRFGNFKPIEIKKDILKNIDNCWMNAEEGTYLIQGDHGEYIISQDCVIITAMNRGSRVGGFVKMTRKPKFIKKSYEV